MGNLAPIAIFTYNRVDYLKKLIRSLKKNYLAKYSSVYFFSDGWKNLSEKNDIVNVRNFIKSIPGFKKKIIILRNKNYGLAQNIINGINFVLKTNDKIIVLEDDLELSKYFLEYMNNSLNIYKNEKEVASIHGWSPPIKFDENIPDYFFIRGADCWGWGTWKRAWSKFNCDGKKLLNQINKKNLKKLFNCNNSYNYFKILKDQIDGKNNSWAIRWHASTFLKNMYTLYPKVSLVNNIGVNKGTHCGPTLISLLTSSMSKRYIPVTKQKVSENLSAKKQIEDFNRFNFFSKIKNILRPRFYYILEQLKFYTKFILPVAFVKIIKILFLRNKINKIVGNYNSWKEAASNSSGYKSEEIFTKSKKSFLMVINKQAEYERDSVLFYSKKINWPLINILTKIQKKKNDCLNVLDFGGSFGSTFFQNYSILKNEKKFNWGVVDQKKIIKFARNFNTESNLSFHFSAKNYLSIYNPDVVIFSAVVQYLEYPYKIIEYFIKKKIRNIFFLKTPFFDNKEAIKIQIVPSHIYNASYPIRIFNENYMLKLFKNRHYKTVPNFFSQSNIDDINHKNFIFKLKDNV